MKVVGQQIRRLSRTAMQTEFAVKSVVGKMERTLNGFGYIVMSGAALHLLQQGRLKPLWSVGDEGLAAIKQEAGGTSDGEVPTVVGVG